MKSINIDDAINVFKSKYTDYVNKANIDLTTTRTAYEVSRLESNNKPSNPTTVLHTTSGALCSCLQIKATGILCRHFLATINNTPTAGQTPQLNKFFRIESANNIVKSIDSTSPMQLFNNNNNNNNSSSSNNNNSTANLDTNNDFDNFDSNFVDDAPNSPLGSTTLTEGEQRSEWQQSFYASSKQIRELALGNTVARGMVTDTFNRLINNLRAMQRPTITIPTFDSDEISIIPTFSTQSPTKVIGSKIQKRGESAGEAAQRRRLGLGRSRSVAGRPTKQARRTTQKQQRKKQQPIDADEDIDDKPSKKNTATQKFDESDISETEEERHAKRFDSGDDDDDDDDDEFDDNDNDDDDVASAEIDESGSHGNTTTTTTTTKKRKHNDVNSNSQTTRSGRKPKPVRNADFTS